MVTSPKGLGPRKDYAGEVQQHIQKIDRPLVREGVPQKQDCNCQRLINIWSYAPDRYLTPRQTGRLTVGRNIRLRLNTIRQIVQFQFITESDQKLQFSYSDSYS
jgi:hypothetical protein